MEPLTKGEYPKSMRSMVGNRLPKFSKEEAKQLKGSFDFLGLNYYSSFYAAYAPHLRGARPALQTDAFVNVTSKRSLIAYSDILIIKYFICLHYLHHFKRMANKN